MNRVWRSALIAGLAAVTASVLPAAAFTSTAAAVARSSSAGTTAANWHPVVDAGKVQTHFPLRCDERGHCVSWDGQFWDGHGWTKLRGFHDRPGCTGSFSCS